VAEAVERDASEAVRGSSVVPHPRERRWLERLADRIAHDELSPPTERSTVARTRPHGARQAGSKK